MFRLLDGHAKPIPVYPDRPWALPERFQEVEIAESNDPDPSPRLTMQDVAADVEQLQAGIFPHRLEGIWVRSELEPVV